MKRIEAIIRPHRLDEVKDRLKQAGVTGMTVVEVKGFGRTGGKTEVYRGSAYVVDFVPKVKIELLVESSQVDKIIHLIGATAKTGKIGDGKVWAYELDRLMRVRTGELGDDAI